MSTYPTGPPALYADWCRQHYALMAEGGIWAVPAAGIVFTKRDGGLVWTAAMPWHPDMAGVVTRAQLGERQAEAYESIREHFAAAGIVVTRAETLSGEVFG
jgi:hypothetical protein